MSLSEPIQADHEKLQILSDRLRAIASCPGDTMPKRRWQRLLVGDVAVFASVLSAHLTHEEESGFFDDIAQAAPRLAARAKALRAEHDKIRIELDHVVRAVDVLRDADAVRASLVALLDLLQNHEDTEGAIAQDAFLTDEGGPG